MLQPSIALISHKSKLTAFFFYFYKFMLIKNTRDFAKLCLIKQKGVKVWLFDKLKPILEYVNNTYGRRCLKSFKV